MRYSSRDLRAVDMLALVLVGFGLAAGLAGVAIPRLKWILCGSVFAGMGFILNAKLGLLIRNGGYERAIVGKPVVRSRSLLDD